jgi:hypothetical protein
MAAAALDLTNNFSHRALPFVGERSEAGAKSFWKPASPTDYAAACRLGRSYGQMVVETIEAGNPLILGSIISSMIQQGTYDGVEIGFCHAIAGSLMSMKRG